MKNWIIGSLAVHLLAFGAWAETIELVTYYPATTTTGDLHATSLTVGPGYNGVTPNDGEAFIENLLSVGSTDPVDIAGGWGAPQRTRIWLQDNTAGTFPALVIAGTPGGGGAGGGAVEFVDATTNRPVGDFGVSGVGPASPASEVGIAARQTTTAISFYTTPAVVPPQPQLPVLRMVILPNGRIGVGTPNPESPLHLATNSADGSPWIGQLLIAPTANDQDATLSLRTTYGTDRVWSLIAGAGGGSTNFRIFDSTAGLDRLNISAAGNVGIGPPPAPTANPSPANGLATGNVDANDVWLRSVNRWASQTSNAPDYDSGWVADNHTPDHYTTFNHNFGDFPSKTEIWFATSNNPTVVYPVSWPWSWNYSGNPVTISMTTTQVRLAISAVSCLHGVWEPGAVQWTYYYSGYWRVKCWR